MTTAIPPTWGERSWLLDKNFQYCFSLDLVYSVAGDPNAVAGTTARLPLVVQPPLPTDPSTYHVLGDRFFKGADQIQRELPDARVVSGFDGLTLQEEGAVTLDGRLILETDSPESISIAYTGVLNIEGGTLQMATPLAGSPATGQRSGTSFISCRQEVSVPKYRWLTFQQLLGIGRATLRSPQAPRAVWQLELSFDLYVGI